MTTGQLITDPKTDPPDPNMPYIAVEGPNGEEVWYLLATDAGDGVTDKDFDFPDK